MKKFFQELKFDKSDIVRLLVVIFSSVIYMLGVVWFLEPVYLLAGGVSGIAQLLNRFFAIFNIRISIGLFVFVLNVPILIIGIKHVSPKFVLFSTISIIIQTILGLDWFVDFLNDHLIIAITYADEAETIIDTGSYFTFSILGGLVTGFGGAFALKYGTSTGGVDIIAQALTFKRGISIGMISLIINIIISIIGGLQVGTASIFVFTVIKMLISSFVVDKVHTSYNHMDVQIITKHGEEIAQKLINEVGRGVTMLDAVGAYTHDGEKVLNTVVSSYQMNKVKNICHSVDSKCFIIITPVKKVLGNFKKSTIA